jgi:hypothetical protein
VIGNSVADINCGSICAPFYLQTLRRHGSFCVNTSVFGNQEALDKCFGYLLYGKVSIRRHQSSSGGLTGGAFGGFWGGGTPAPVRTSGTGDSDCIGLSGKATLMRLSIHHRAPKKQVENLCRNFCVVFFRKWPFPNQNRFFRPTPLFKTPI